MEFERVYNQLLYQLLNDSEAIDRGEWHAQNTAGMPKLKTFELRNVQFNVHVPGSWQELQDEFVPNLPWAEDHFKERISGLPINPPPSHEWWPFGNTKMHQSEQGAFSHSYPERYWCKWAGDVYAEMENSNSLDWEPHPGIRFEWGDLADLVILLAQRPMTRQAYLPVWFPEDLTAARAKERCPCSLGYHFLADRHMGLSITYFMRSCDFVRHFRDDMYLTARLLQWVVLECAKQVTHFGIGDLHCHIASLHCMAGDLQKMEDEYEALAK